MSSPRPRFALLAAGASVETVWPAALAAGETFAQVYAVNASGRYAVDWFFFTDATHRAALLAGRYPAPAVGTACRRADHDQVRQAFPGLAVARLPWRDSIHLAEDFPAAVASGLGENCCTWTFPNALASAAAAAARADAELHVFGFDITLRAPSVGGGGCVWDHDLPRWRRELPWVRAAWSDRCIFRGLAPRPLRDWLRTPPLLRSAPADWPAEVDRLLS